MTPLVAAFHAHESITSSAQDRASALAAILAAPERGAVWISERNGTPAGYAILVCTISLEFGGRIGTLDELYVRPDGRGQGMARCLVKSALTHADATGLRAVFLEADRENPGLAGLYGGFCFLRRARYDQYVRPGPLLPKA